MAYASSLLDHQKPSIAPFIWSFIEVLPAILRRLLAMMGRASLIPLPVWEPYIFLSFLVPSFFILFLVERWFSPSSNFVPLLFTVWATLKYGRQQRKLLIDDMNNRRRWHMQNTEPLTPSEPCEWLNKLIINIWPNYMEPKLSYRFAAMMMKKLKASKPKFIETIELEEFSLGLAPPVVGLECTYWTSEENEQVLHTGFHWDTDDMSIVLGVTVAGPIKKRVVVVVNSLHIKGDLRIVPILDGHCVLYSFEAAPVVRMGLAFGGISPLSQSIELPGISLLLEKIMTDILKNTMVEPRRNCFAFPAVNLQKHVSGAVISVTIVSGNNLSLNGTLRSGKMNDENSFGGMCSSKFVKLRMDKVTRKTHCCDGADLFSRWEETFDLMLDGSTGSIYIDAFEQDVNLLECHLLGRCKVKVKYIQDDSTVFWAVGRNNTSIAACSRHPGDVVDMIIPLEGNNLGEVFIQLVVKQWHYTDDPSTAVTHGVLGSVSSFQATTGRTIRVVVEEARNLLAKDESGSSDPYVLLQYGKAVRRTKTIPRNLNPAWNQPFEFAEISGGEYLKLKCYDADLVIDDMLGSARVNMEGLDDDVSRDIWVPLENVDTGEVRLTIRATRAQSNHENSKDGTQCKGMLELVLLEARDLIAADLCGTSDPFVSVHYGKQKKRTKVIYKNVNPQWNQTLEFPDDGKPLELHVKDHNTLLPTSSIGHCTVDYKSLLLNQTSDMWIRLEGVRKGEIHIQITRRYHMCHTKSNAESVNMNTLLSKTSSKISSALREALQLAEEGEMEQLCEKIAEIEVLECEQDAQVSQVFREKELLLSKIQELERAMESSKAME